MSASEPFCLSVIQTVAWEPFFEHRKWKRELSITSDRFDIYVDWGPSVEDIEGDVLLPALSTAPPGGRYVDEIWAQASFRQSELLDARHPSDLVGRRRIRRRNIIRSHPDSVGVHVEFIEEPYSVLQAQDETRFICTGFSDVKKMEQAHRDSEKKTLEWSQIWRRVVEVPRTTGDDAAIYGGPTMSIFLSFGGWDYVRSKSLSFGDFFYPKMHRDIDNGQETIALAGLMPWKSSEPGPQFGIEQYIAQIAGMYNGQLFACLGRYYKNEAAWRIEYKYGRESYIMGTFWHLTRLVPVGVEPSAMEIYKAEVAALGKFEKIDSLNH